MLDGVLEQLDLTTWELALAAAAAVGGAVVQGAIGFGYALVLVPVLLLCAPRAVPVAPIVTALPMVLAMVARERRSVDARGVGRLTLGRVPGTVLGAWVVAAVSVDAITLLVGTVLVLTVALTARLPRVETSTGTQLAAGFASGVLGTVSALGGPVMGLALQSWPGPELRATLSVVFAIGLAMSLAGPCGTIRRVRPVSWRGEADVS